MSRSVAFICLSLYLVFGGAHSLGPPLFCHPYGIYNVYVYSHLIFFVSIPHCVYPCPQASSLPFLSIARIVNVFSCSSWRTYTFYDSLADLIWLVLNMSVLHNSLFIWLTAVFVWPMLVVISTLLPHSLITFTPTCLQDLDVLLDYLFLFEDRYPSAPATRDSLLSGKCIYGIFLVL